MTRALKKSGIGGRGQEVFPEAAKEVGRRIGLVPELVTILRYHTEPDGGGDTTKEWKPDPVKVRGRIKSVRRLPKNDPIGGRVSEGSTHIVELDPDIEISTQDRLEIEGIVYLIVSREPTTAGAFLQLEVKER